jgi:hypothetical protein
MTHPVLPAGSNAAQVLAFCRTHRIVGTPIRIRHRRQVLREYRCLTHRLDGEVVEVAHRILAPPEQHACPAP